jgi:predicted Ser/Thr protein kinase
LPPDVPLGLCPECLIKAGFKTGTEPRGEPARFIPPAVEQIKPLFPQLEIIGLIGQGGMGAVYQARQPVLDRFVALKILPPGVANSPGFPERFNREARALARLIHPNIVAVHDFGRAGELHYLIMEFVDGANLREVERAGRLAPEQALAIVPQICDALQFAHNEGIIHRDIKPENILLDKKGRVKITDFGIAKILGLSTDAGSLTGAKDVIGTPHYMAPEQIERPTLVDHRADIFSLGVVFYEMLTGELPLGKFAPPSKKGPMDARLDDVVMHALEKEPAHRFQHASEVKTEVETISGTPPLLGAPPAPPAVAPPAAMPPPGMAVLTAPAVALMVAAGWKLLSAITGMFVLTGISGWLHGFLHFGNLFGLWAPVAVFAIVLFKVIPAVLIFYGGFQMLHRRSYAWAMAAAILSVVACSLIGFPVGIWALIVLARQDVKSAFGSAPPAPPLARPGGGFWGRFAAVAGGFVLTALALGTIGWLVFRTPASVAAGVPVSSSGTAMADSLGEFHKDSTQFFPLDADGRFSIDNVNGRTEIHGWSSNAVVLQTAIHGQSSESVEAVKITIDANPRGLTVHTEEPSRMTGFPWSWLRFKNSLRNAVSVDYIIQVPQGARLAEISAVNGPIKIDGMAGDVAASVVNGSIRAEMASLGSGQAVSLNSVNGTLELVLPGDADADVTVNTINGSISSEFSSLKAQKEFPVGNTLRGSLGLGGASVKAATVNGGVRILKSGTAK